MSVPLHAHVVLKSVPKIPNIASLHSDDAPAHFFVTLSTAQDCSYFSRRVLKKGKFENFEFDSFEF